MRFQEMLARVRGSRYPVAVCAHRGDSLRAPENTMAAFEAAMQAGADAIEFDVQCTEDGQLVVLHDDELKRTTDGEGKVRATRFEALRRMDAGSWFDPAFAGERVPTLDEALGAMAGKVIPIIEVKGRLRPASERANRKAQRRAQKFDQTEQRLEQAAARLEGQAAARAGGQERWEDSNSADLVELLAHRRAQGGLPRRLLRRMDRAMARLLGKARRTPSGRLGKQRRRIELRRARLDAARQRLEESIDRLEYSRAYVESVVRSLERHDLVDRAVLVVFGYRAVELVKEANPRALVSLLTFTRRGARSALARPDVDGIDPRWQSVDAALVRRLHAGGKFLTPWTVNDTASMRRLVELGADAIISDHPRALREAIAGYQAEWLVDCRRLLDAGPLFEDDEEWEDEPAA